MCKNKFMEKYRTLKNGSLKLYNKKHKRYLNKQKKRNSNSSFIKIKSLVLYRIYILRLFWSCSVDFVKMKDDLSENMSVCSEYITRVYNKFCGLIDVLM